MSFLRWATSDLWSFSFCVGCWKIFGGFKYVRLYCRDSKQTCLWLLNVTGLKPDVSKVSKQKVYLLCMNSSAFLKLAKPEVAPQTSAWREEQKTGDVLWGSGPKCLCLSPVLNDENPLWKCQSPWFWATFLCFLPRISPISPLCVTDSNGKSVLT